MQHQICGTRKLSRRPLMFLAPFLESRAQFDCACLNLWQSHPFQDCFSLELQEDAFALVLKRRKPAHFARKGGTAYSDVKLPFDVWRSRLESRKSDLSDYFDEAAELLRIHPKTLQRMARNHQIHGIQVGKLWRFRASDLEVWLRTKKAG